MSRTSTNNDARPGRTRRRRIAIPTAIALLAVAAVAAVAALTAPAAVTHPSYGQPCSRCHTQTKTMTVTFKATPLIVARGGRVVLSGTVAADHTWTKVNIQKRTPTGVWKLYRSVTISGTTFKTAWTAPTIKCKRLFRAVYQGDRVYKRSVSAARTVTVR